MPKRKNRQYGYVDRQKPRKTSVHRATPKPRKKRPSQRPFWAVLLLGLWTIIKAILRVPVWLFHTVNRLSPSAKQGLGRQIFRFGVTLAAIGFVLLIGMFAWVSRDLPDPDRLTDRTVAQSTKIFDRTGEHVLFEVFEEQKRTLVELEDIPEDVINGVIATEDTAFYEHKGVRPLSILRSFATGRGGGGASTLTQQLVKNAILSPERTITRKMKELILSVRLEQKFSKDQILKIYFNEIPYGSTNYGIQSASQSYFGKDVGDLTLSESAVLAGLPKAPTRYLRNDEALKTRRDFVLARMEAEGFITTEEKEAAQAEELSLTQDFSDIQAVHFALDVRDTLIEEYGELAVASGGLKVISSLDWELQQYAEAAVKEESEKVFEEANANNTSLVAIDPETGHVLAMVGSRDFNDDDINGKFNVATLGLRQPGSSFKPIVYTAAFEKGYTPETVLFDVETNFAVSGRDYKPLNYNLQELGGVTMRQALQGSLNIPAVKALYLVGETQGVDFARRLGYSTLEANNFGLSLVLGGGEVTLLEHVNAYATIANEGVFNPTVSILKVEKPDGEVLFEWKKKRGERVLEKEVTATISNVLSDDAARAYAFGAGGILTIPGRPVAAKTGTTNSYVDAWTVGYTPSLAVGVWAGNTDNSPMTRGFGGSKVAAPIWNNFMRNAMDGTPVESFPAPPENDAEKPALRGSEGGSITLKVNKVTGNLATTSTPENLIVERTYTQAHSILHYVQRDDPRGAEPSDPSNDPQYQIWEDAIQDWVRRKKEENPDWEIVFDEPPAEYDDVYSLELIPTMEIVFPTPSSTLRSRDIQTDIRVSAPRGVSKVTYRIDERYVGVVREHPFNLSYNAQTLSPGNHTLTVIVEDDVGNRLEETIPFTLDVSEAKPTVNWAGSNETISSGDFPRTLFLEPFKLNRIKSVRVVAVKDGERETVAHITDFNNLFNGQIPVTWNGSPGNGRWELQTEIELKNGDELRGDTKIMTIN